MPENNLYISDDAMEAEAEDLIDAFTTSDVKAKVVGFDGEESRDVKQWCENIYRLTGKPALKIELCSLMTIALGNVD